MDFHTRSAVKWLYEISHSNPLWISTPDAARYGIVTGDLVGVATDLGGFLFGGGGDGDEGPGTSRQDALKETLQNTADEARDLLVRLEREVTALNALTEAYSKALSEHLNHMTQVARLRMHVADFLLYYLQAKWTYEPADQRLFRLHQVPVPTLKPRRRRFVFGNFDPANPSIIENPVRKAIARLDAILDKTDGVMVARGDLGVEMPLERLPTIQKDAVALVNAVNDAPSFTKGPDQTVAQDSGAHSVPGWATAISMGPANESGQTPTAFLVSTASQKLQEARADLERRKTEIARLQALHSSVVSSMSSGLVTTDGNGVVTYANPAARELLQRDEASIGSSVRSSHIFSSRFHFSIRWRMSSGGSIPRTTRPDALAIPPEWQQSRIATNRASYGSWL